MAPRNVTVGVFAVVQSCLTRTVGGTPGIGDRIATTDVTFSNAIYQNVWLVLGCGMRSL